MSVRRRLYAVYHGMRRAIAPRLRYAQEEYEDALAPLVQADSDWLDLGCGHMVLPAWRAAAEQRIVAACRRVVGIDYDWPSLVQHASIALRVRGDIGTLPFRDGVFDLVTANMVVEHLARPDTQFREIARVLRPGGRFLLHTPNADGYGMRIARALPDALKRRAARSLEGRESADVFHTYYRANTEPRLRELAAASGFRVERLTHLCTDAVFAVVPPLAALELLWIRLIMTRSLARHRPNIIALLRREALAPSARQRIA